jgi:hypothetical protein
MKSCSSDAFKVLVNVISRRYLPGKLFHKPVEKGLDDRFKVNFQGLQSFTLTKMVINVHSNTQKINKGINI